MLIQFSAVTKTYWMGENRLDALKGITFNIEAGSLTAIIGASGSGKSSVMNILGLLDKPTSGNYLLNEQPVSSIDEETLATIRNRDIGFVFQSFFLLPRLTVLENVCLPMMYRPETEMQNAVTLAKKVLSRVGMQSYTSHKPHQLSGGQQQRVAIARALIGSPKIILADEPTGALDSHTGQEVMDFFKELNREDHVTTIIVTHDPRIAAQCMQTIEIIDGHLVTGDEQP